MKTQKLWIAWVLVFMAFSFISCDNDDDKADGSWLVGKWIAKEFVPKTDSMYAFYADGTYDYYISGPAINGIVTHGTYKVSSDGKQISLNSKTFDVAEKYNIVAQASEEMEWERAAAGCEHTYMKLEKYEN